MSEDTRERPMEAAPRKALPPHSRSRTTQIVIDGAAGAGKSSVGEAVARRLGYLYVDSAVFYRALTVMALRRNVPVDDEVALLALLVAVPITITPPTVADGRQYTVLAGSEDITPDLHILGVAEHVSVVARHPKVREALITAMRATASAYDVVMVGRDIGMAVLPDATLKITLSKSPEERARHRHDELVAEMGEGAPSLRHVLADIEQHDRRDAVHAGTAPGAIRIENRGGQLDAVVDQITALVHVRLATEGLANTFTSSTELWKSVAPPPPPPSPVQSSPSNPPASPLSDQLPPSVSDGPFPPIVDTAENERTELTSQIALDRVAFAAYYPKEVDRHRATPLLIYLALDEVGTLAKVAALAAERLTGRLNQYRSGLADARMALRRGAKLRLVPTIPGFRINPQWMDVTWDEDAQQHEFSIRAAAAPEERAAEGAVRIYQGLTLRAEIPLSIFVARKAGAAQTPDAFATAVARAYRSVFASYSHRDTPVVQSCEAAARAIGDRYLRDVMTLRSGQIWSDELKAMIAAGDVFQLFWSKHAAISPFVRQEWEYALTLQANRPGFIRPVYWSSAPHTIPHELSTLHFEPLSLTALGWSTLRRVLYSLRTG